MIQVFLFAFFRNYPIIPPITRRDCGFLDPSISAVFPPQRAHADVPLAIFLSAYLANTPAQVHARKEKTMKNTELRKGDVVK